jgi:ANTAR domain/GAF domain
MRCDPTNIEWRNLPVNSQSAMFLQAAQLVADLHQRASLDTPALLRELIAGAAESVPGAQYSGITVTERRRHSQSAAATHRYPVMLDEIQSRYQQGPCLTAAALQDSVRIDDLDAEDRWPLYREEALKQTPIRSILSFGMFREGGTTAALNFYAEPVNAFDDGSVNLGLIFASHTALVWNMMRRDQQFRSALASRDIIGQAKGRLMERFDIDAAETFELLRRLSQESNTPIAHIAQRVVTGDRPLLAKHPR